MKQNVSILTVNSGSSSLKLTLHKNSSESKTLVAAFEMSISNIGARESTVRVKDSSGRHATQTTHFATHEAALTASLGVLSNTARLDGLSAVGHRIVFGAERHAPAELITSEVLKSLRYSEKFDPDHMPTSLRLIEAFMHKLPGVPQIACYDTAFYADLPRLAQMIALPREFEKMGVRRYGYHGLSYSYLLEEFGRIAGKRAAKGRVIFAHLGSGASLVALKNGAPVDMTMGFTPSSGVMMSSRSGDLDPGVSYFLQTEKNMSPGEYYELVNKKSGLLGVSGLTADMEILVQKYEQDDNAAEAVDLFCYQVQKAIGALSATIGGIDSIVFTGGIGEQSHFIRKKICSELEYLGVALDRARNEKHLELISAEGSKVGVHVLPTHEAQTIAALTRQTLENSKTSGRHL